MQIIDRFPNPFFKSAGKSDLLITTNFLFEKSCICNSCPLYKYKWKVYPTPMYTFVLLTDRRFLLYSIIHIFNHHNHHQYNHHQLSWAEWLWMITISVAPGVESPLSSCINCTYCGHLYHLWFSSFLNLQVFAFPAKSKYYKIQY